MQEHTSFQTIIENDQPVLIDFYATWCGPCQAMSPVIKDLAKSFKGKARVIKIDIDKNEELSNKLAIRGVPTFAIYQKGELKWRQSGMQTSTVLSNELEKLL